MTNKQKVRRKFRHSGCQFSAMRGYVIVDYGKDGYGHRILAYSARSESEAWRNAAKKL